MIVVVDGSGEITLDSATHDWGGRYLSPSWLIMPTTS